jgi:hypothetical protein
MSDHPVSDQVEKESLGPENEDLWPRSCVPYMKGVGERGWDPGDLKQQFQSKRPWEDVAFTHTQLLLMLLRECNR